MTTSPKKPDENQWNVGIGLDTKERVRALFGGYSDLVITWAAFAALQALPDPLRKQAFAVAGAANRRGKAAKAEAWAKAMEWAERIAVQLAAAQAVRRTAKPSSRGVAEETQ